MKKKKKLLKTLTGKYVKNILFARVKVMGNVSLYICEV